MIFTLTILSLALTEAKPGSDHWFPQGHCYNKDDIVSCIPHAEHCVRNCAGLGLCKYSCQPNPDGLVPPEGAGGEGGAGGSTCTKCGDKCCYQGQKCAEHKSEEFKKLGEFLIGFEL